MNGNTKKKSQFHLIKKETKMKKFRVIQFSLCLLNLICTLHTLCRREYNL